MTDIEKMADDYYRSVQIVEQRICERRNKLKKLSAFSRQARELETELGTLYRERRDALETADHLKDYYA